MKSKQRYQNRYPGSVLALMLIVLAISSLISLSLMALGEHSYVNAVRQVDEINARTAADSGFEEAVQALNNAVADGSLSNSSLPSDEDVPLPSSDASYSYSVTYSLTDGYRVESVGQCGNQIHRVHAKLSRSGLFDYGISCQYMLSIDNGVLVDAYDSRISDDPADCSEKVTIGSQCVDSSNVNLNLGVVVDGDIFCGPGQDVTYKILGKAATVTGDKYTLDSPPVYPIMSPPNIYGPDTDISFSRSEKTIGPGGDYPETGRYSNINLGTSATLRVTGDCTLVITERVNIGAKCTLIIEEGASLTVYVDSGWNSGTGSDVVNQTGDPSNLCIIQSSDKMIYMDIQAKNDFSGVIYAPKSGLNISTSSDFRGAVISYSLNMNNAGRYLYDVALKDFSPGGSTGAFQIERWNED